jgi:hypothetical protein
MENKILLSKTDYDSRVKKFSDNLNDIQKTSGIGVGGNYGIMTFIVDKLNESGFETDQEKLEKLYNIDKRKENANKMMNSIEFDEELKKEWKEYGELITDAEFKQSLEMEFYTYFVTFESF